MDIDASELGGPIRRALDRMVLPNGCTGLVVQRDRGMDYELAAVGRTDAGCFVGASNGADTIQTWVPTSEREYAALHGPLSSDRFKSLGVVCDGEWLDGAAFIVKYIEPGETRSVFLGLSDELNTPELSAFVQSLNRLIKLAQKRTRTRGRNRRVVNLLTLVSLLLCAAACVLWVRGYWRSDLIGYAVARGDGARAAAWLCSGRGGIGVVAISAPPGRVYPVGAVWRAQPPQYGGADWSDLANGRLGLYVAASRDTHGLGVAGVCLPAPVVVLSTAVLPVLHLLRRRRRLRPGQCAHCGYNLTGNVSGVCPECGTPRCKTSMSRRRAAPCRVSQVLSFSSERLARYPPNGVIARAPEPLELRDDIGFFRALAGDGSPLLSLTALVLIGSGLFALFLSATGHFLPHDEQFLGMTAKELCALHGCRIVHFMYHDRASFGGALVAVGLLYLWLVHFPLRRGEAWAWWALLLSGAAGFASFLAYLGYGYLDTWHGAATLALLPCFAYGMYCTWRGTLVSPKHLRTLLRPSHRPSLATRHDIGRTLILATALVITTAGLVILTVGTTHVFVDTDLAFLGVEPAELHRINPRLVPLIAHDRAGFGGGLCCVGLTVFACAWRAPMTRSLWQSMALSGTIGFGTAIAVHPLIGYNDATHVGPAVAGALVFWIGLLLCAGRPVRMEQPILTAARG